MVVEPSCEMTPGGPRGIAQVVFHNLLFALFTSGIGTFNVEQDRDWHSEEITDTVIWHCSQCLSHLLDGEGGVWRESTSKGTQMCTVTSIRYEDID